MHSAAFQIIDRAYDTIFYLNEKFNGSRYEVSEFCGSKIFLASDLPYQWPLAYVLDFASFFGCWDYVQHHMSKESKSTQEDIERAVSSAILGLGYWPRDEDMNCMNGIVSILLNYLPRCTDTNMPTPTATGNNQVGDYYKWTILLASVSRLLSFLSEDEELPLEENLQEMIGLCKQVIKTLMKHDAGADINMLLTYELLIDWEDRDPKIIVKETLLAFVKRRACWDLDLVRDIEAFLCDLGAIDRRIFHSINCKSATDWTGRVVRKELNTGLTHNQSQRLSKYFPHERLRQWHGLTASNYTLYERLMGLGTEDAMPTEPDPEAEDLVNLLIARAPEYSTDSEYIEG